MTGKFAHGSWFKNVVKAFVAKQKAARGLTATRLTSRRLTVAGLMALVLTVTTGSLRADTLTLTLQDVPVQAAVQALVMEQDMTLIWDADGTDDLRVTAEMNVSALAQALDTLLHPLGLVYQVDDSTLRVFKPDIPGMAAGDPSGDNFIANPVTSDVAVRYIQVNYADAEHMLALIAGEGGVRMLSEVGRAGLDARTNTLIIADRPAQLSAIEVMLTELDVPVSQVLIEARIVSASLESGRELGLRWGAAAWRDPESDYGQQQQAGLDMNPRDAVRLGLVDLRASRLLELELSMLENSGHAELMARPRVITQDNTPAAIRSGVRIPYQAQAGGTAGGSITQFVDAVLSLEVTPQITPDGRIIMSLLIRQDSVASGSGDVPAINTNTVETRVLIDNSHTLVLGGIFREEQTQSEAGMPGLRQLPLLGGLFRRRVNAERRTELLIFITPRIIPAH